MNWTKIVLLAALALAVLAAFVTVPYVALILAVAGVVTGWTVEAEIQVRVIVSALALSRFAGIFDSLPTAGHYLTSMLGNVGTALSGVAVAIILHNILRRVTK